MSYIDTVGDAATGKFEKKGSPHRKITIEPSVVNGDAGYLATIMPNPKDRGLDTDGEIPFFIGKNNLKMMLRELLGQFNKYSIPTVMKAIANDRDNYMNKTVYSLDDVAIESNLRKAAVRETIIWKVKKFRTAERLENWLNQ